MSNKNEVSDTMRFVFGLIILLILIGLIVGLFFVPIPKENESSIFQLVGTVCTLAGMIIGFCFGSSYGSKQKTDLLNQRATEQATGKIDDPIHVEPTDTETPPPKGGFFMPNDKE